MNVKLDRDLVGAYLDLLDMAEELDREGGYASFEIKVRMLDLCCKVEQTRQLTELVKEVKHLAHITENASS